MDSPEYPLNSPAFEWAKLKAKGAKWMQDDHVAAALRLKELEGLTQRKSELAIKRKPVLRVLQLLRQAWQRL